MNFKNFMVLYWCTSKLISFFFKLGFKLSLTKIFILLIPILKYMSIIVIFFLLISDTYVKLSLVSSNGQEIARSKTSVRRGQPNPLFKETFIFQVNL